MVDKRGSSKSWSKPSLATSGGRKRPRASASKGVKDDDSKQLRHAALEGATHDDHDDEEEASIRELVFGKGDAELLSTFGTEEQQLPQSLLSEEGGLYAVSALSNGERHGLDGQPLWVEDVTGDHTMLDGATDASDRRVNGCDGGNTKAAAWVDEDDAALKVDISAKNRLKKLRQSRGEGEMTGPIFEQRLCSRFTNSNVTCEWAKAAEEDARGVSKGNKKSRKLSEVSSSGDDEEEDIANMLLRDSSTLKGDRGRVMEPGYLNIVRCKDANQNEPSKSVVRAVSFHSSGEILLAGGFDKTLRLFQVDGVRNTKIHSIFFEDLPISNAKFTTLDQAIITGRRSFFYWYDVPTGKAQKVPKVFSSGRMEKVLETFVVSPDGKWLAFVGSFGYVLLLSNKTKQWAAEFKLNCTAIAVAFTNDSQYLLASGIDADVYKFDIRSRRCVLRFFNEGGTSTISIDVSSTNRLTAVGSDSGVVNVYDESTLSPPEGKRVLRPSPLKAIMSLTTPVTTTKFSPDGQMLAIASSHKRDGLKVIHAASCSPFTNWPTERTPVRYPFALDFSPGGGYLAVGNDRGCVLLYRVRHYAKA